ncbi:MAG: nucleotidyltransferase domain-containing protein [Deltaproteobacteria bacterium]|nr:nucleotidyltransferase domain-containing protein [Deltaproteobacteria bacterium]
MKYILDQKLFFLRLREAGFKNLLEFSRKAGMHRNTLANLCAGKNVFTSAFQTIADHLGVDPNVLLKPVSTTAAPFPIEEIRPILARIIQSDPNVAIVLFGSRAGKHPTKYSDWDLGVIRFPDALSGIAFLRLKRMVEEASEDLVRRVDVVNLHQAPSWFLTNIADQIHFLDGNREAWIYLQGIMHAIQRTEKAA